MKTAHPSRCLPLVGLALLTALPSRAVSIREAVYEDRPQFVIKTAAAEYWLDRQAGGLSRLIDHDGRDWIAFRKEPLSQFPASAAAGYRGIPNAIFGDNYADEGAGHPGFDPCESSIVASNVIRTVSKSGRWAWTWTFTGTHARLKFERVDPGHRYWFLYEGTPGGRYAPTDQFWGTDRNGPLFDRPDIRHQRFGKWRWAYFGDRAVNRVLALAQVQPDELDDTFWYLGSSNGGAIESADGMVVFGFGRGPGTQPLLRDGQPEFLVKLIALPDGPDSAPTVVRSEIEPLLENRRSQ